MAGLNITYAAAKVSPGANNATLSPINSPSTIGYHHPTFPDNNESFSTIGSPIPDVTLNNLISENEKLKKKIEYLQKIISLKDNTIDDLNKKLIIASNSSNNASITTSTTSTNSNALSHSITTLNPLDSPSDQKKSLENSIHMMKNSQPSSPSSFSTNTTSDITDNTNNHHHHHHQSHTNTNNHTQHHQSDSSQKAVWEIPQRSINRSNISPSATGLNIKNLTLNHVPSYSSSTSSTKKVVSNNSTHIKNASNDLNSFTNTPSTSSSSPCRHMPRISISSLTSSHYSNEDTNNNDDDLNTKENQSTTIIDNDQNKNIFIDSDIHLSGNNTTLTTNSASTSSRNPNNLTLELENRLSQGDLTLGSSPRKSSPNRLNHFNFDSSNLTNKADNDSHSTTNLDEVIENSTKDDADDFDFGSVHTPDEPVYKKLNRHESYNSQQQQQQQQQQQPPLITPTNDRMQINKYIGSSGQTDSPASTGSYSNSILATPSNKQFLHPSTTLQNQKSQPEEQSPQEQTPPAIPTHPPPLPHTHHKRVISADDSEKFLLNSMDHCIIRIESLIDPQILANPIDFSNNNNALVKSKRQNYKVIFLVYTDENNTLTPIYRVRKSYLELLSMDKIIRPIVPNLPKLPDFQYITSLNYKNWATSKKVIQDYINKILILLKSKKAPLDSTNSIWKQFSNYFEFKMDNDPDLENLENSEYSVLNLQKKLFYLLYIRKNFGAKTYDFVKFIFNSESNEFIMDFNLSKSQEILSKDEVLISYKNQEISIKKKKKLSNKSWVFYAESEFDASEIVNRVRNWIGVFDRDLSSNEVNKNDDLEISTNNIHNNGNNNSNSNNNNNNPSSNTSNNHSNNNKNEIIEEESVVSSPSITTPWKIFKKSSRNNNNNNNNSDNSNLLLSPKPNQNSSSSVLSIPSTPSKISSSLTTPSSGNNDVLNFKAMPYDSNKIITDNSKNYIHRSPMKTPNEALFQPIDEQSKYFTSSLQYSYNLCPNYKLYGFPVPSIVYQCITFLYKQGGEGFEGIFRLNGMMSEVNKIQEIFNNENDCDLSKLNPLPDVHSIATLLKRYLRYLSDKLIDDEIATELCLIINNFLHQSKDDKFDSSSTSSLPLTSTLMNKTGVQEFRSVFMNKIPQLNRNVLYVLFKYLRDVLKMGKYNKMTISAMSVLMGPNLTHSDGGGQICTVLLENFSQIFV